MLCGVFNSKAEFFCHGMKPLSISLSSSANFFRFLTSFVDVTVATDHDEIKRELLLCWMIFVF